MYIIKERKKIYNHVNNIPYIINNNFSTYKCERYREKKLK